jgi:hypothetical protein
MILKKQIRESSDDPLLPFKHLEPIVWALTSDGNRAASEPPFLMDQDGWYCGFIKPINFDLLESQFEFPTSIQLSRIHNTILDTKTWVEIKGG